MARQLRKNRQLSIKELARLASLDNGYLSRLERGVEGYRSPRIATIRKLARALKLTREDELKLFHLAGHSTDDIQEETRLVTGRRPESPPIREAYVLLQTMSGGEDFSDRRSVPRQIALLAEHHAVEALAVTVWGFYDVVVRLRSRDGSVFRVVDDLHAGHVRDVLRTETILIRDDGAMIEGRSSFHPLSEGQNVAFVLLQAGEPDPIGMSGVLTAMKARLPAEEPGADFLHAGVAMGAYDVVAAVWYTDEIALRNFVLRTVPPWPKVSRHITLLGIRETAQCYALPDINIGAKK